VPFGTFLSLASLPGKAHPDDVRSFKVASRRRWWRPGIAFRADILLIVAALCLGTAGCRPGRENDKASFHIVATDAEFEAPSGVPAGLRHILFENHGTEIHESMMVKLSPGTSAEDYVAQVKRGALFPTGGLDYSGPGLTSPGESTELWARLDPGNYILICWNDGHAATRPVHPFVVSDTIMNDELPPEDLVVKLIDYRYELSRDLQKGVQVLRIETPGPSMHEMDIFRLHLGKTAADLYQWRKKSGPGPAPFDSLGGALDNHDIRRVVWLRRNFSPGHYLLHCEMPLTANSQTTNRELTHQDLGMVREIEVKK
jgi:hypothetical protein